MFPTKLFLVAVLGISQCNGMPSQPYSPMLEERSDMLIADKDLAARNVLGPRSAMEELAIDYAQNGQLDDYFENAVQAVREAGDHELADSLNGAVHSTEITVRDGVHARQDAYDPCVNFVGGGRARWHNQSKRQHLQCYSKYFPGGVRASRPIVRAAAAIILQHLGHRQDAANAGLKLLKAEQKKELLSGGGRSRALAVRADQSVNEMSVSNIFGIHFPFLNKVAHIISVVTTFLVAATVCAEGILEPPAFFLLSGVVWSLCGALIAEIPVAVIETVACFNYQGC